MAQTPQQRRANAKFAKTEEKKMGKPESLTKKEKKPKPPVSTAALIVLAFVVCGGIFFELLKLVPALWDFIVRVLAKVGVMGKGN